MIEFAKKTAVSGMEASTKESDVAAFVRQQFDQVYGPTWNVIVGRNFGSDVTHETKQYINFDVGQWSFLVWKSG